VVRRGYRLLPAHFYFELITQMREFERPFSQSVDEFLEIYPSYIERVPPELNGLFRQEDYPSAEKLRAKFGVKFEELPIPSGDVSIAAKGKLRFKPSSC
jgi:hypothetical protein